MVEVDGLELEIVRCRLRRRPRQDAFRHDILDVESLAVLVVGAFALVGSHSTAPEKIIWKYHCSNLLESADFPLMYIFCFVIVSFFSVRSKMGMKKAPLARRYAFKVVGRDGFEPS